MKEVFSQGGTEDKKNTAQKGLNVGKLTFKTSEKKLTKKTSNFILNGRFTIIEI